MASIVQNDRRVVIVDFNHMAWAYAYGNATALSCTIKVNGVPTVINTTIPAYTIKTLNRWAKDGKNLLAVCFDGRGSAKCRKAYFAKQYGIKENGAPQGYKARRESSDPKFFESIDLTYKLLCNAGVYCYKLEGYEADDLVKACVDSAKKEYPNLPIDVITGDADLLPLVDDQVSVFMRSTQSTYAESKDIEKLHYVQVTPRNFQSYVQGVSAFKKLQVPYNTVLLAKLLRGDKSDEIKGKPDWKPKMYNQLIDILENSGEDLSTLFRYDAPTKTIVYKGTTTPIPPELIDGVANTEKDVIYGEPPTLTRICEVLGQWCEPEDLDHIRLIYNGINLNGAFTDLGDYFYRRPAWLSKPIQGYNALALQAEVGKLNINLNLH